MISPQIIDKIFDVAAIEEVVGEYVSLKKAGANYKGLCPFHDDKNPSMSISPSKGIFKCFSCGEGGNVFQFIMKHEGLSYPLAIKHLADKYNIPIEEGQIDVGAMEEEARLKDSLYATLEFAKNYFNGQLKNSQEGKVIYKPYLGERGIRDDSIETFQLGLSSLNRDGLLQTGLTNGYTVQQLFDAGLVKKIDENLGVIESNLRDTFIERIMYPIYNVTSKVLGFGGRIIKKESKAPKYINSPETAIYEKRKVLYGLHLAKNAVRKLELAYLVEGYMDVISLHQSGVENVLAVSGTSFTEEQARLLKRFTKDVVLLFDGDEAGVNASLKHINTLLKFDINPKVVLFPEGEDPDSYVQAHGKEGFEQYVEDKAEDFVRFIAKVQLADKPDDAISKAKAGRRIAESISQIPDPLKRAAYVSEASELLGWQEQVLIDETNKFKAQLLKQRGEGQLLKPRMVAKETVVPQDNKNYQEFELLKTLILHADKPFDEELSVAAFMFSELVEEEIWPETPEVSQILREALDYFNEHQQLNELFFIRNPLSSAMAADYLSSQYRLSEGWMNNYSKRVPTEDDTYKKQVVENLNYLKLRNVEQAIIANQEQLKTAETEEDILHYQTLQIRLQELKKKITSEIGAVVLK